MLRGDWLKSEKGVMLAMTESMCVGASSTWVVRPATISLRTTAMSMYVCSNEPIISTASADRFTAGRIMRAGDVKRNRPANAPAAATGTHAISSRGGTPCARCTLRRRSCVASAVDRLAATRPITRPSSNTATVPASWWPWTIAGAMPGAFRSPSLPALRALSPPPAAVSDELPPVRAAEGVAWRTERHQQVGQCAGVGHLRDHLAHVCQVIQKAARRAVGRVNRAQEAYRKGAPLPPSGALTGPTTSTPAHVTSWSARGGGGVPHESGSSLRTVVVRISAKKAPR